MAVAKINFVPVNYQKTLKYSKMMNSKKALNNSNLISIKYHQKYPFI